MIPLVLRIIPSALRLLPICLTFSLMGQVSVDEATADRLAAANDFVAAAQLYDSLAQQAPPLAAAQLLIKSGTNYRRAKAYAEASDRFAQINQLPPASSAANVPALDSLRGLAHHLRGLVFYLQDDYKQAAQAYLESIHLRDEIFPKGHNDRAKTRYNLAVVLRLQGKLDSAEWVLQESNRIYQELPTPDTLRWIRALNYLGLVQHDLQDRQLVISSTSQALRLAKKYHQNSPLDLADAYYFALQCLSDLNAPDEIIRYADAALELYRLADDQLMELWCLNGRSAGYLEKNNFAQAAASYQEMLPLLVNQPDKLAELGDAYFNLSLCQAGLEDWPAAFNNGWESVQAYQAWMERPQEDLAERETTVDSSQLARSYAHVARYAGELRRGEDAANYFSLAFGYLMGPNFSPDDFDPADVPRSKLPVLADFLGDRAHIYEKENKLNAAMADYNQVFALQDRIRADRNSQESQRYISQNLRPVFQQAIHLRYLLFQSSQEEQHLWEALRLAERSKAFSLLFAVQRRQAEQPRRERELRRTIATLERETGSQEALDLARLELERLLSLNQEANIEPPLLATEELQSYLRERNTHLLEYALGEEHSYVFHIAPGGAIQMAPLTLGAAFPDEVAALRNAIRQSVYRGVSLKGNQHTLDLAYTGAAFAMYSKLIAPLFEPETLPEKLLFIPDGVLGYVPFSALLTEDINGPVAYQELPYVQRARELSFSYSAQYLLELAAAPRLTAGRNLLALAPSFSGNAATSDLTNNTRSLTLAVEQEDASSNRSLPGLVPLRYNAEEVAEIAKLIPGTDTYLKATALRSRFEALAKDYRILHISSHALVNADDPNLSFIAFSQTGDSLETTEMLFLNDLYALPLQAELAVLSACETSMGQYAPGEGVLSLARAFAQAGAASTLTTLWKVDDQATKELMVSFYAALEGGASRAAALAAAQAAAYTDVDFAHPYYWSALTLYGRADTVELAKETSFSKYIVGLVIGMLVAAFMAVRQKRKENREGQAA